jgi:hypothetical protein
MRKATVRNPQPPPFFDLITKIVTVDFGRGHVSRDGGFVLLVDWTVPTAICNDWRLASGINRSGPGFGAEGPVMHLAALRLRHATPNVL